MARGKRGTEDQTVIIGGDGGGPVGETAAFSPDSTDGGTATIEGFTDPAIAANGSGDGGEPERRRRGRPKGSGNRQKAETVRNLGADGVAAILVSIHSALVMISKCPEMEISEDEATKLAKASVTVAKLYDVQASEKAIAWTNLLGVAGSIYLTRMWAINMRWKMEAEERKARNGNVTQFPGQPSPPLQPRMN